MQGHLENRWIWDTTRGEDSLRSTFWGQIDLGLTKEDLSRRGTGPKVPGTSLQPSGGVGSCCASGALSPVSVW